MRGAIVFVVWAVLFVGEVITHGILKVALYVAMVGAAMCGGYLFAGWRRGWPRR